MAENGKRQLLMKLKFGPDGTEQLEPVHVDAHEGLSQHFTIVIEVLAQGEIELLPNLGLPVSLSVENDGEFCRYFHGIVIDACFLREIEEEGFLYQLTLAPSAHFHEQGSNYRIYQGKTVIEIIKDVLERCKIDFDVSINSGNRKLPYCVQYGESDFSFVCRLMEEEGLYYYYRHDAGAHVMMICDRPSSHTDLSPGTFTYDPQSRSIQAADSRSRDLSDLTFIQSWQERASSGAEATVTMRDYDFMQPGPVKAVDEAKPGHAEDAVEIYRWPGRYYHESEGKALTSVLLESRRAQRLRYEGNSQFPGMQSGRVFSMVSHPNGRFNRKYLIISCHTHIAKEVYRSGMAASETSVAFTSIPDDVQFRAPIVTPRPVVNGPETAVVVGPRGENGKPDEEIHVDKYGRIKVQFHWDRAGERDDRSSCWIRVSQTGGLGNIIIPRVNHEVLVDFINGNPDRPIVVGRVFNAANMPHHALPEHKTRAVWRSKTYQRESGENHLYFDDKTDNEEVYLHAQKDMNTRILNNETHHVDHDVEIKVGDNRTETVGINETITIGKDRSVKVEGEELLDVDGNITVKSGKTILISAIDKITLKVDKTEVTLDANSIKTITKILEQTATVTAKIGSMKTTVEGASALIAKGGIVKIN